MKKFILTFVNKDGQSFDYSLTAECLGDADRRGQNLQELFNATLVATMPTY